MRILVFLVVMGVLLMGGTYFTRSQTGSGSYKTTTYGWPDPWVYVHDHEVSKTTEWRVDWQAMVFPGILVFSVATVGSLILVWRSVRGRKE